MIYRITIFGLNGGGKSTLIRALAKRIDFLRRTWKIIILQRKRQMMKKFILLFTSLIILTSCKNDMENKLETMEQSNNNVIINNDELDSNYQKLKGEYDNLISQLDLSEKDNVSLSKKLVELNIEFTKTKGQIDSEMQTNALLEKELLDSQERIKLQSSFKEPILWNEYMQRGVKEPLVNGYNNIFDASEVKVDDIIDGFRVISSSVEDGYEKTYFEGSFILTGELSNDFGFNIYCDRQALSRSIPISKTDLELYTLYKKETDGFYIRNEEVVQKELGDDNYEKSQNGTTYKVTAIFNNYLYALKPDSCVQSSLELVEILSIEEMTDK